MITTGMIRRIDDLGRVVIPKEIRKKLTIGEGDPLEIYMTNEGVCLKKYCKLGSKDWELVKEIISQLLDNFAVCDNNGEKTISRGILVHSESEAVNRPDLKVHTIREHHDTLAYLVVQHDCDIAKVTCVINILKSLLRYDFA